ncbi:MAG: amidohydrolase family protein [Rhizobiales bacterium]|nr:amidohydrolase family protein [Hyphomicrobiales bacterium]
MNPTSADRPLAFVDAHHHFQDISHHLYPWLTDQDAPAKLEGDLGPIRRDYLPADYADDVASGTVTKTVHVQNGWDPRDPAGETRWLQNLAETVGRPTAIVAYADLADPAVERLLAAHAEAPALRGIRQILNWHEEPWLRTAPSPDLMSDANWRRGFALLRRFGLSFDLQVYWPQMDQALALARAFPDTWLILDHFGMPIDRSRTGLAHWGAAIARLAQAPNVAVKLSGFGLGHPGWTIEDTVPLLLQAIDVFGPKRSMVGTNLPVDRLFAHGREIVGAITASVAGLSETEREAVRCGTAERIYRI